MFLNQAMIVIDLSKMSGLFNRVYFIKTFKNNICRFFVFEPIRVYPVEFPLCGTPFGRFNRV